MVVTKEKRKFAAIYHIGDIIMLGINAPKVLAKGKYAQAIRKAALASQKAKDTNDGHKATNYPYKFEWVL